MVHGHTSDGRCGCARLLGCRGLRGIAPGGQREEAAAACGKQTVCNRLQQPVGLCRLLRLCAACARAAARDLALSARDRPAFRTACAAVDALTRGTSAGRAPAATRHADRSE